MARRRRQAKIPAPAWDRPRGTIGSRVLGRSSQFYGALGVIALLALALGIVAWAFVADELEKRGRPGSTAIQVEDTRVRLDYFSRRLEMYVSQFGGQGAEITQPQVALPAVSDLIIEEEVLRRFASELEISVSEDEIQEGVATRLGITVEDETFDVVYQQELARTGLSDADYRSMVEANLLRDKVKAKFRDELPESAESVRYRQIMVSTNEAGEEIRSLLDSGEDFAALASERSIDTSTKDAGGEVGWVPKGALDASTEALIFALEVGDIDVIPVPQGVLVVEMEEKADDRPIEDSRRDILAQREFDAWVDEKRGSLKVVDNMDLGEGDPEKIEWAVSRAYNTG